MTVGLQAEAACVFLLREVILVNITDIRMRKMEKPGKMKALASITIDDEFVVHDIKVIEGEKGLFIAMPSRKSSDGIMRDIAHPINSETRGKIQDMILENYKTLLENEPHPQEVAPDTETSSEPTA